eukprot:2722138-Pleurochrysis_carterae.AAC.2
MRTRIQHELALDLVCSFLRGRAYSFCPNISAHPAAQPLESQSLRVRSEIVHAKYVLALTTDDNYARLTQWVAVDHPDPDNEQYLVRAENTPQDPTRHSIKSCHACVLLHTHVRARAELSNCLSLPGWCVLDAATRCLCTCETLVCRVYLTREVLRDRLQAGNSDKICATTNWSELIFSENSSNQGKAFKKSLTCPLVSAKLFESSFANDG